MVDNKLLKSMLGEDPQLTSAVSRTKLFMHHLTVLEHIQCLGFVLKNCIVQHRLTGKKNNKAVQPCADLLISPRV